MQDLLREHDLRHYQIVDKQNPHRLIRALEVTLSSGNPILPFLGEKQRPDFFESKAVVIDWERENLYKRINTRVDQMVAAGLEKEAEELYPHKNLNALQTVGYRSGLHITMEKFDRATAIEQIKRNSRRYAKRQTTWFRRSTDALRINGGMAHEKIIEKITAWI